MSPISTSTRPEPTLEAATAGPAAAGEWHRRPHRTASAIYEGEVYHRRLEPFDHGFAYRIFLPLFDLDELPGLLDSIPLWSARRGAPARFRRSDYLGPEDLPLAEAARARVNEELGDAPDGPVRLLANPRYLGVGMNPVAFYYLHGSGPGEPVEAMIAEVTNTPWGERRSYVMRPEPDRDGGIGGDFEKALHVSPFMPMDQSYRWSANEPGEKLTVRLENLQEGRRVFAAGVSLERREISSRRMLRLLVRYPPMTVATLARIYWQAVRLKIKGAPYHRKPAKGKEST